MPALSLLVAVALAFVGIAFLIFFKVLVAPRWITAVSWRDGEVSVNVTRQAVKDAPPYDAVAHLNPQQEMGLHEHYGRPGNWTTGAYRESGPS